MQLENNNRNCDCSNNMMDYDMMTNDNNNMNLNNSCCCECKNETEQCNMDGRSEMIKQIKCYRFAIIELGLYLDTHPTDQKALCLHRKYCKILKELEDKYQKVYGPLTINYPCNKWRWLEEPWPWERGNF